MNTSDTLLFNDSVRIKQCRGGPVALGEIRSATPAPVIHCHRASVIEERRHRFNVTTPAERQARRKRFAEAGLTCAIIAAVAMCGVFSLSHRPGAINSQVAPGAPLTAENAPVRWQRKDFPAKPVKAKQNPSSGRVPPSTANARRGDQFSPASGIGVKRKGASK